jgi:hypothetical protein
MPGQLQMPARRRVRQRFASALVTLDHHLYGSADRLTDPDDGRLLLRSVALTVSPARISARPVRIFDGSIDYRREPLGHWPLADHERQMLRCACEAHRSRCAGDPIYIRDLDGEREHERAIRRNDALQALRLGEERRWG